ncbi:SRPBCC family protein [Rathayibacter iranicus]|uniref:SRPBCC domain-containing protein n=2 Tax=Rathayibacter iranicus TaxID=59737 RepID=A0AAD2JG25_9MICO|nr:SRPBCC domain-containing protein [Rathayibacter iranicus]AZZ54803.1 SRPBCC domain-containing protein [Rathayibacter iranicus]MWV31367.1 SRPBCC domain-containing protein [Rathayibacter iranicus NCPPB 2253 = VKM Ac-1602]PPI50396.1 polyketide cyclase [Rathayibacter iranicus]PPI62722.1 polyketide cyclase [Rathayibacter iranicus]PPI73795.1 polyketide cyclase [Rathayibacter iranicus]
MTVLESVKDVEKLTLTITAEFESGADRVWLLWTDPRKLERWWGPPTWPATFERHEPVEGGRSNYAMTGPDGEQARGWWRVTLVDEPTRFEFEDGFADEHGEPIDAMGVTRAAVTLNEIAPGRTRMTIRSNFDSLEQLEQMVLMGMEEGMRQAIGQIDAILLEG